MTCRFGAAVDLVGLGMQDADALGEHGVFEHVPRWRSILPGVVAAGRDIEHAAHGVHGKSDLLRAHELEDGVNVLSPLPANQAVAFDIRGFPTTVRLKVEQIQLVSGVEQVGLGRVGLQGA